MRSPTRCLHQQSVQPVSRAKAEQAPTASTPRLSSCTAPRWHRAGTARLFGSSVLHATTRAALLAGRRAASAPTVELTSK
jgi:hypothetical protein